MGDEITRRFFDAEDFSRFRARLDDETLLLRDTFAAGEFSQRGDVAGFELEAWLTDQQGNAVADNEAFLNRLDNPLVVPELARFNIELNGSPSTLSGNVFTRLQDELAATWSACRATADDMGCRLITIGILPTADESIFTSDYMSSMVRYQSLNDRVMALRDGRPLAISIEAARGGPGLELQHPDVMLEAAATSFQVHLQCRPETAVRDFNASIIASAPIVAVSANSPFFLSKALWDETRIALFEQSVDVGNRYPPRVSFGDHYANHSLIEIFEENARDHLILIPRVEEEAPASRFSHVRFHNGTLWRWNRPLIGFDFDGQVHFRIEHRVISAQPTLHDNIASAAFYYGLVRGMGLEARPPEQLLAFEDARTNFYQAARNGLDADVLWPDERGVVTRTSVRELIEQRLLPLARRGLQHLEIPAPEIDLYLGTIGARVANAQNGAAWQRRWVNQHGADFQAMVAAYETLQDSGEGIHAWPV